MTLRLNHRGQLSRNNNVDKLKDQCGIFGIYAPGEDVARISYFGLYSLQHRGQEGAGITISNRKRIKTIKGIGLVSSVFDEKRIASLKGDIAVGHVRYSTTGGNTINNVQPIILNFDDDDLAIAHNGNIVNAPNLIQSLPGVNFKSSTDTEVMGWIIKKTPGKSWTEKILKATPQFKGAFSIVGITRKSLFAFRDPYGFRPLVLGKLNGGYVISSESCALDTVGATYIRDIKPGEIITIDSKGLHVGEKIKTEKQSFCLFEYVYLGRPDSVFNHELVHQVRQRSGEILAYESPVNADMVVAIPDSGTSAAIGYSIASSIPFGEILIKNRYIGRTFIQPEQRIREMGVKIKFNPLKKIVKGKRIIIIDDSIVRGTTIKKIIQVLRNCGTKKIHVRVCSPPIQYSCYFGVDTPDRKNLIASDKNIADIKKIINADSLEYLSLPGLIRATRQKKNVFCAACFNGKYPVIVDGNFTKNILEKKLALLISNTGTGTNLQAVIDAIETGQLKAKIAVVVSDTNEALGLQRAKKHHLSTLIIDRKDNITKILKEKYQIDFICLAGWKRIIPDEIIAVFKNRIFNIHPGLIPDKINGVVKNPDGTKGLWNKGKLTDLAIQNFFDHKATYAGSSVHFLSQEFDFGPVLARCFEKILQDDTIDSLYSRLKKKENKIYVQSLIKACNH